ncbi:ABC transporter ATP-binding protein [Devosia faecipullorum]|uniref:ABC transporter ATP-binding protein n=1 Tax=Devosia faecipullorum TaxID=2755039 RepID=UPI00187B208C|nr:ABC transporter ATP-binding protein [Devosia faecipullorum]MBE7733571.1 ABC transporter ATP-binding protein [Devosia faecipullorum]
MSVLKIKDVTKIFSSGQVVAVDTFSLDVADGELVCLLGPSGSGKSTLLRMVGGFEQPSGGLITIDGEDITHLPPEKRPTGMVFQSHALWTHMNVFKNLAFGLKLRRLPADEIKRKVEAVLELVGLGGYGNRHVGQLSGGQQQRVALARSLVLEPKILLLDEPFASLDQHLRERLREEVRDIQQRLGITTLFVTHGQDEALSMADRIVVMRDGRTEQIDRPDVIYRQPKTPFVAGFIGTMNLVDGQVSDGRFSRGGFTVPVPVGDGPAILAVRPEALDLEAAEPGQARVHRVTDYGTHGLVDLDLPDGLRLKAMVSHPDLFKPGQGALLKPRAIAAYRDDELIHQGQP